MIRYRIYATLLDSFQSLRNCDEIYEKYWGRSESPQYTLEEFRDKKFQEFFNGINRIRETNEQASRGSAFNEVIDCIVKGVRPSFGVTRMVSQTLGDCYQVEYDGFLFYIPIDICRTLGTKYRGAITQYRTEAVLPTRDGDVLLYGYIDELMPLSCHDIKTTGAYSFGKFADHNQHLVYPYCLLKNGMDVTRFDYDVIEIDKSGRYNGPYTETYNFDKERDTTELQGRVEELVEFLEANKSLITEQKIFNYRYEQH